LVEELVGVMVLSEFKKEAALGDTWVLLFLQCFAFINAIHLHGTIEQSTSINEVRP
jgi:hypothetical protein